MNITILAGQIVGRAAAGSAGPTVPSHHPRYRSGNSSVISAPRNKKCPHPSMAFPAQHLSLRPSGVFSCWPDGLELTPGFYPGSNEQHRLFSASTQNVHCTCSRVTSASSALGVLNDYALYKSTHALTHSLTHLDNCRNQ